MQKKNIVNTLCKLSEIVPLSVPLGLSISIGNICDFNCTYCLLPMNINKKPKFMTIDEFKIIADQITEFNEPIKQITFVSQGETILNHELPEMIRIIKSRKLALNVKVITNANLLTFNLSDRLIDAGLDMLKISLQGISTKKYKEICGIEIDFDKFTEQIRYFYMNKKSCKLHIKNIDIALNEKEKVLFYEVFGEIADFLSIEKCIEKQPSNDEKRVNKYDISLNHMKICPMPFYTMMIEHTGNIPVCCLVTSLPEYGKKTIVANLHEKTLKKIWEENFFKIQNDLLLAKVPDDFICNNCKRFIAVEKKENNLDDDKKALINSYSEKLKCDNHFLD